MVKKEDFDKNLRLLKDQVMMLSATVNQINLMPNAKLINTKCAAIQKLLADIERLSL
ncbi:hypothetical protein HYX14_00360 [Candidatus Woesearchaeota archaeon]|nr:hypothetical protein [Candidatus Woesearchaeota archaeon]